MTIEQNQTNSYGLNGIITVSNLAQRLGVTPRCIQRWIRLGKLPACREIGRRRFWLQEELLAVIAAASGTPKGEVN